MTLAEIEAHLRAAPISSSEPAPEVTSALAALKANAVVRNDQVVAKRLWCLETVQEIQGHFLRAFSLFREGKFYDGWCLLEKAEIALSWLAPHLEEHDNEFQMERIAMLVARYQKLFPYSWFFSPEIIELAKECTICGKVVRIRHPCGHRVGEIYDGVMCARRVTDFKFMGGAVVQSPVQKYSVLFLNDPETKETKDHYDYSRVAYIVGLVESALELWDVTISQVRKPLSDFGKIGRNAPCPCRSKKKFKACCLPEGGILSNHYQFSIHRGPGLVLAA